MEKRADPSSQHDVDRAILDYLLYSAITALIHDFGKARSEKCDQKKHESCANTLLKLVDCTLAPYTS